MFVTTSYFSRSVQREVLADRYPLVLINGARLANVVRQHLVSASVTLEELLATLDSTYDERIVSADPEQILMD